MTFTNVFLSLFTFLTFFLFVFERFVYIYDVKYTLCRVARSWSLSANSAKIMAFDWQE